MGIVIIAEQDASKVSRKFHSLRRAKNRSVQMLRKRWPIRCKKDMILGKAMQVSGLGVENAWGGGFLERVVRSIYLTVIYRARIGMYYAHVRLIRGITSP